MNFLTFFLRQHAAVHARDVSGLAFPVQRVFDELSDDQMRIRPGKGLNSLVWLLWHMARTEDASSALRHNAAHIGEAVTVRGLAGFGF